MNSRFIISLRSYVWAIVSLLTTVSVANAEGIVFEQNASWSEIREVARKQNKLIFIDVYTDWCGPCKLMEQEVFSLKEVGDFYNTQFVNYKFDAEKGEGIALKKQFGVRVYPTYLFVDPQTEEVVHFSTSRQEPSVFLFTGKSALDPLKRSVYLEAAYAGGNRDQQLLKDYAAYLNANYQRDRLDSLIQDYFATSQEGLRDPLSWHFFMSYQSGTMTDEFTEFLKELTTLKTAYGEDIVNQKLENAFDYDLSRLLTMGIYNAERFDSKSFESVYSRFKAIDFEGKDLLETKIQVLDLLRIKDYQRAAAIADEFPRIAHMDQEKILAFYQMLYFPSRSIEDITWLRHALTYVRYIASNDENNRSKALNHYNYALFLERYIQRCAEQGVIPSVDFLQEPAYGEKRYTMSPAGLKPKPKPQADVRKN